MRAFFVWKGESELDYSYRCGPFSLEGSIRIRLQLIFTLRTTTLTQPTSEKTAIHQPKHTTSDRHQNNTTTTTTNNNHTYPHIPHHTYTHTPHIFSGYAHISPYLSHLSSLFSCPSHLSSGFFNLSPFLFVSLSAFCLFICGSAYVKVCVPLRRK